MPILHFTFFIFYFSFSFSGAAFAQSGTVSSNQKIADNTGGFSLVDITLADSDRFSQSVAGVGDLDNDGVEDIAVGAWFDDTGGADRGAVYVLLLNSDGTVKSSQKIADNTGGFNVTLTDADKFGVSVAGLGDLDNDGVEDIAVGAYLDDTSGTDRGAVYVLFMNSDGTVKSNQKIADNTGGFNVTLTDAEGFGISIADLGDLDNDGIEDLAVGGWLDDTNGTDRGAVYVLFMNSNGTVKSSQKIADNTGGFNVTLTDVDQFGRSATGVGDLDNDGVEDLAVGTRLDDTNGTNRGAVYVLFMNTDGTVKSNQKIADNTGGFNVTLTDNTNFGISVAGLGDLDNDGVEDLAVGAYRDGTGGTDRGAVYVLFMNSNGTVKSNQKIADNTGGFNVTLTNSDRFGISIADLGDLDGDGIKDLAVGAALDDDGGTERGAMYVLFMNTDGTVDHPQKISDTTGEFSDSDNFGRAVARLGDLDNDSVEDLAVGAFNNDTGGTDRGAVYVLFMNTDGTVSSNQKIADNTGGFNVTLTDSDRFGVGVANVGDLDNDGVEDLAVGASGDDTGGADRGAVYVLFMNSTGTVKSSQKIADNTGGFNVTLTDSDAFGVSVAGVGDLDNDGVEDLAVGATQDNTGGTGRGAVYVLLMNSNGTVKSNQKIADNTGGFNVTLTNDDRFGISVAAVGDLDNDGVEDLAVGAYIDDTGGLDRGAVYVLFMNSNGTVKSNQKIADNTGGFNVTLTNSDRFGISVAALGDLDNDGVEDLAVGADKDDTGGADRGGVYVLLMNTDGTVKSNQKIADNTGGFNVTLTNDGRFGVSVAALGDLDNDGVEDLAVGAFLDDTGGTDRGVVYVLFLNQADFAEVGNVAGVDLNANVESVAWGDYDGDGDQDLYVSARSSANKLYRNDGDGTFTNVATSAPLNSSTDDLGIAWGDYDNDGDLDIYMGVIGGNNKLLNRNTGSDSFTDQAGTASVASASATVAAAWGDYDNDGDLDLYITVSGGGGANIFYENDGDGTFTDKTTASGLTDTGDGRTTAWADYDNDGDLDLVLANFGANSTLFRNDGNLTFTASSAPGGAHAVTWGDYDNDGDLEIYITHHAAVNSLFRNDGSGAFTEVGSTAGVADISGLAYGAGWADYDNDGDLDLAVVNSGFADRLFSNGGSGTFTEVATTAGLGDTGTGRGMAWADYDGDGDMDLYVATATGETNLLYKNNGNTNKWLHVKLTGVANNRSAIGTVVTAVTGATRQFRQVSGGDGYQSQGSLTVEFGFGSNATVDSLIVEWPAGFTTVQTSVATNQTLSITEPAAAFTEVGSTAGVDDSGIGSGASWGDYDGDGDPDLYVVNSAANKLYRNDGSGSFTDVSPAPLNDGSDGRGAGWGDVDSDGDLDLYLANSSGAANKLFRNNGAGSFSDVTVSPLDDVGYGTQVALADYDNDGDLDIYLVNQDATAVPNRLFKNDGSGTFTEVGSTAGVDDSGNGRGGGWGDYDGDGDPDLYVANNGGANKLYSNDGDGTFTDASAAPVNDANDGVGTAWGDYDIDGDLDLYLTNFNNVANKLFKNNGSGTFTEVGASAGVDDSGSGDGASWADYDGDGDLDLYVTNFNSKPNRLYKNNGNSNRWLHVKVEGTIDNRDGIGAIVTAVTGSIRQRMDVDGGSGYLSQSSLPVEFGFGSTVTVDSLIIEWPLGLTQVLTSVGTNDTLNVHQAGIFEDVGELAAVSDTLDSFGAAWGDYDKDGDADLYVTNASPNRFYRNDGSGAFTEVGSSAGVADAGVGRGAAWGDYDNDGNLDLYLVNNSSANRLYQNSGGGTFTDRAGTAGVGDTGTGYGAAWADYDRDGNLDLYLVRDGEANRLYQNNGDSTFTDVAGDSGVNLNDSGNGRVAAWGDIDNDSDPDLYLANNGANVLYRNDGDSTFSDASTGVADGGGGLGVTFGDYDNDGDLDLYLANNGSANRLYQNDGTGSFTDVATSAGVAHAGGGVGAMWGDYDNDGFLDLHLSNGGAFDVLYQNDGDGTFTDVIEEAGVNDTGAGQGGAWADFDEDGDLDLFLSRMSPNRLFENRGNTNRWLRVELEGVISNQTGIGANIVAVAGALRQRRDVDGGSGFLSQPEGVVTFGFGGTATVDSLIINWPSDINSEVFTDQATNVALKIVENVPPVVPTGLTATAGPNQVTLSWTANTESDLSHYIILRSTVNGFTPTPADSIARVDPPAATFTNTGLTAGTFYYRITAVDDNNNVSDVSAQVSATLAPAISFPDSTVSFGDVSLGETSLLELSISNPGTAILTISSMTLAGADSSEFLFQTAASAVGAGQTSGVGLVVFGPSSGGSKDAKIVIVHNAAGSPDTVLLSGNANVPSAPQILVTGLNFGDVDPENSKTLTLNISNTGASSVSIDSIRFDTDLFTVSATAFVLGVEAGRELSITFSPTIAGTVNDSLRVFHNGSGGLLTVFLTGRGVVRGISLSAGSLAFGDVEVGRDSVLTLEVSNTGNISLTISGMTISGTDASDFTVSPTSATIAGGGSSSFGVTFLPSSVGTKSASLSIAHNAPGDSVSVSLSGTGTAPVLTADFSADTTSGPASLEVQFTDLSGGGVTGWSWDFGDGEGSTEQHPSHIYASPGIFSVTVTVSGAAGSSSDTTLVDLIRVPPRAGFTADPLIGEDSLNVAFSDTSLGAVTLWSWSFGDGDSAFVQHPSHTYRDVGLYTVSLGITGPSGSDLLEIADLIEVKQGVVADFSADTTSGQVPLAVSFSDSSSGPVTGWSWAFGDGDTSTVRSPFHKYTSSGVFGVELAVIGTGGVVDTTKKDSLITVRPLADFSAFPTSGLDSVVVAFQDSSLGGVTSWSWDFGDGETSTDQNPEHIYRAPGAYTVGLTVGAPGGSDTVEKLDLIEVKSGVLAAFGADSTSGRSPLTIAFIDSSRGSVVSWSWSFGDGDSSAVQNPSHTYSDPGIYSVSLGVTGAGGESDTTTKASYVRVAPIADFVVDVSVGVDSLAVAFTDSTQGPVTSWSWSFGDGDSSFVQHPKHVYREVGVFSVSLDVSGPSGTDRVEKADLIEVLQGVKAIFEADSTSGRVPLTVSFRDSSTGPVTSWLWLFGDNDSSTVQHPTHTYTLTDTFNVTLTVTGTTGTDTRTVVDFVEAMFNFSPSAPVPVSAPDSALSVSLNPRLVWERAVDPESDAITYDLFLGSNRFGSTTDTSRVVGPLSESTDYAWHVVARDGRGGLAEGATVVFTTVGDTIAPVVLQEPTVEAVTESTFTVFWKVDEVSTPLVEYREDGSGSAFTASSEGLPGKDQRALVSGGSPGATFEFRVVSRDTTGNAVTFPDPPYPTATTLSEADTTGPGFTEPATASHVGDTTIAVVWTTDESGTTEGSYRLASDTTFTSATSGAVGTAYRLSIEPVLPESTYVIRVRSEDVSGNASVGVDLRVTTTPRVLGVIPIQISNLSLVGRTSSQGIIEWSTNLPSSSLVEYGLGATLQISQSQTGEDGVLEHRVTLSKLQADTEYFYRAISAGSGADTSDVLSFKTKKEAPPTPTVITEGPTAEGIDQDRATVFWKTDVLGTSTVAYDTVSTFSTNLVTNPEPVTDHAVTLTGLPSGRRIYYRVKSVNLVRLVTESGVDSFTTLAAPDTTPPVILESSVPVRASDGFTATWKTNEISTSQVLYAEAGGVFLSKTIPGFVLDRSVSVSGLKSSTDYVVLLRSADPSGNSTESDSLRVTTLSNSIVDRTSPQFVGSASETGTTDNGTTIVWGLDEPGNSVVEYGTSVDDLFEVAGDPRVFSTDHAVRLTGLSAATKYFYRISTTDVFGNGPTRSSGMVTTKAAPDTIGVSITSGPTVLSVTDRSMVLEFLTDELSDTQVDFAPGPDTTSSGLTSRIRLPAAVTLHRVTLTDLIADTIYAFRVGSQDLARNARTFSAVRTRRTEAAPDIISPDFVGTLTALERTASTLTIAVTTDEPTDLVLEYGITAYDLGRIERGSRVLSRSETLTGLQSDTEYRIRVTCRDQSGNAVTSDPTITIPPPRTRLRSTDFRASTTKTPDTTRPVIVEGPEALLSGSHVGIRWVTDELCNSRVVFATPSDFNRPGLESEVFDGTLVTVHRLTLSLDLNTQYLFRVESTDAAGNRVMSGSTGSTKPAGGGLALQPPGGDGSFVTPPVADLSPPVILSGPTLVGATSTSLTLEYQTDEAGDSFAEYGIGEDLGDRVEDGSAVTKHRLVLTKLSPGTSYQFVVGSTDLSRNGPATSKPGVGSTAEEVDVTPPVVRGVSVTYKSDRQAVVVWTTDEPGSSTVEYGTGGALSLSRSIPDGVTEHRVVLTNLSADTPYSFRAGSLDISNNGPTWSTTEAFDTDPTPDTTLPDIPEDPEVSAITDRSAIVTWTTDESSDSGVDFGTSSSTLDFTSGSAEPVEDHRVVLTKLDAATTYFLRVSSTDRAGNGPTFGPGPGQTISFTTAAAPDTIAPPAVGFILGQAGSRAVLVNWQSLTEPDLAGYNLYRGTGSESLSLVASNLSETRFRDEGLIDEVTYRYAVTAFDGAGNESVLSDEVSLTPSVGNAPSAPAFREVRGETLIPTFVVENASGAAGRNLIYTFHVSVREDFADVVDSATDLPEGNESTDAGQTAWTITRGLTDGAAYFLRVRASDGTFDGPFTAPLLFRIDSTIQERPGDFDGDLVVGFDDFFLFAAAFGLPATGENRIFDLSVNGEVDFDDFFEFAAVFGVRYESQFGTRPVGSSRIAPDPLIQAGFRHVAGFPAEGAEFTAVIDLSGIERLKGYGIRVRFEPEHLELLQVNQEKGRLGDVLRPEPGEVVVLNYGEGIVRRGEDSAEDLVRLLFRVRAASMDPPARVSEMVLLDADGATSAPDLSSVRLSLVPDQLVLKHNYPNPFNPITTIRYGIPEEARVSIVVYNILGQQVAQVVNERKPAGFYTIAWDGRDTQGRTLASGVYIYRIQVGKIARVQKMMLLK